MTNEEIYEIFADIDSRYVKEAREYSDKKRFSLLKGGLIASVFALVLTMCIVDVLDDNAKFPSYKEETKEEYKEEFKEETKEEFKEETKEKAPVQEMYEKIYSYYVVDGGEFSDYVGGKVISADKIGSKFSDVTLTAGWKNGLGQWISTEKLRGEIYLIDNIPKEVAVALKFIDKGEAVSTSHFYVVINPQADLSAVKEYIIVR